MKNRIIWLLLSVLLVLSLVLASCGEAEEEEEEEVVIPPGEEEEVVVPPSEEEEVVTPGGNWWDYMGEPEYGGKLTLARTTDVRSFDLYRGGDSAVYMYQEHLSSIDWTLDRKIWSFPTMWTRDDLLYPGGLAEAWEQPDGFTQIYHIRQGANWQDKDPANGAEVTASDIAWSYNRLMGKGSGFTEPTPYMNIVSWREIDSIEATDKYTVVVKYNKPNDYGMLCNFGLFSMMCPYVVEKYGNLEDWKNAVGTGPFILKDYVVGGSLTYDKNPNYWGWDERHPENKVPYVDGVKILIIPDSSTMYAALRTGKIDLVGSVPWEQALQLLKTNPELQSRMVPGNASGLRMRVDVAPFTDIRVRKAMNMAIDRKTIAETYYGGLVEGRPYSIMVPTMGDYYTPFESWPEELQEEYTYNPEGARSLLAEAGYPDGFKTNAVISSASDMDLALIFKDMLLDVGIDMELKVVEATQFMSYVSVYKKHDQMAFTRLSAPMPKVAIMGYEAPNAYFIDDPVYNQLGATYRVNVDEQGNYKPLDQMLEEARECELYILAHHWDVAGTIVPSYTLWQPWIKGYLGESTSIWPQSQYARWWIDKEVKKSMGY